MTGICPQLDALVANHRHYQTGAPISHAAADQTVQMREAGSAPGTKHDERDPIFKPRPNAGPRCDLQPFDREKLAAFMNNPLPRVHIK